MAVGGCAQHVTAPVFALLFPSRGKRERLLQLEDKYLTSNASREHMSQDRKAHPAPRSSSLRSTRLGRSLPLLAALGLPCTVAGQAKQPENPAASAAADRDEPGATPSLDPEGARRKAIVLKATHNSADKAARELKQAGAGLQDALVALLAAGYTSRELPAALGAYPEADANSVIDALRQTQLSMDDWVAILVARKVAIDEVVGALMRLDMRAAAIGESLRANKVAVMQSVHAFANNGLSQDSSMTLVLRAGYTGSELASGLRAAGRSGLDTAAVLERVQLSQAASGSSEGDKHADQNPVVAALSGAGIHAGDLAKELRARRTHFDKIARALADLGYAHGSIARGLRYAQASAAQRAAALSHIGVAADELVAILRKQEVSAQELAAALVAAKQSPDAVIAGMRGANMSWGQVVDGLFGLKWKPDVVAKRAKAHKAPAAPLLAALLAQKLSQHKALHALRVAGYEWTDLALACKESGMTTPQIAVACKQEGAKLAEVVASLRKLGSSDDALVSALREARFAPASIASELIAAGLTPGKTAAALAAAELDWNDVAKALASSRISGAPLLEALKQAQCPPVESAVALKAAGHGRADIARFMKELDFDRVFVARALKKLGSSSSEMATSLRQLGYPIGDVALALRLSELPASTVTAALKSARFPAAEIPAALAYAGYKL